MRTPRFSTTAVNTKATAVGALLNAGYLDIYDGVQPASADLAVTTQVRLARLTFGTPAFATAISGTVAAHAIAQDTNAAHSGTATWFRCVESDGVTMVCDGSVGTADADVILSSVDINAGQNVALSAFTLSESQ